MPLTARAIIEARLGHPLPPTRQLAPDERQAIKRLAMTIIRAKAEKAAAAKRGAKA